MSLRLFEPDSRLDARVSRRALLKGTAAGAGLTILAGTAVQPHLAGAGQIEVGTPVTGTPVATELPLEPLLLGPTVQSKAAELNYDIAQIFRFVSDEVRYEPYSGALRGANGTLWSLAGNSVDKSILFAALLDESLIDHRFAEGVLEPTAIELLTTQLTPAIETLWATFDESFRAGLTPPSFGELDRPTPEATSSTEDQQLLDDLLVPTTAIFDRAQSIAEAHIDVISTALREADIAIPSLPPTNLSESEVNRHIWVQVPDGSTWSDYDPTLSQTSVTGSFPEPIATYEVIPSELSHTLVIKLVAEEFLVGTIQRREVVSLTGPSSSLVNVPIGIAVFPPEAFDGIGLVIKSALAGSSVSLVPALVAGHISVVADVPLSFGSSGRSSGVFGDATPIVDIGDGETLGLWLEIDIQRPGAETIHIQRTMLDRVSAAARTSGIIGSDAVAPLNLVEIYDGKQTVAELAAVHLLTTDVARLPFSYAVANNKTEETFGSIVFNAPSMTAFRDALRLQTELAAGYHSFIAEPQCTLTSIIQIDPETIELAIDLLRNSPSISSLADSVAVPTIHPRILAGILDQVAEQLAIDPYWQPIDSATTLTAGATLSTILSTAVDANIPIVAVSNSTDLSGLELGAGAVRLIEAALADGWIAIAPRKTVSIDGKARSGWWLINPTTGQTRDQLDNGKASASFRVNSSGIRFVVATDRGLLARIANAVARFFRFLGRKIDCVIGFAGLVFAGMIIGYNTGALGSGRGEFTNAVTIGATASGAAALTRSLFKKDGTCL